MLKEPLSHMKEELKDTLKKHVCFIRDLLELTTRIKRRYRSGGTTALIIIYIIPIKKLALLLISWSKWLLQSKLHRKEFRRKKFFLLISVCNF